MWSEKINDIFDSTKVYGFKHFGAEGPTLTLKMIPPNISISMNLLVKLNFIN